MEPELVLRWMSELQTGSIRDLQARLEWIVRTWDVQLTRYGANTWIRETRDLGHIEVDWESDHWEVTEPVVCRLPCVPELGFVTGSRRHDLQKRLENGDVALHVAHIPSTERCPLPPPPTILLQADSIRDFASTASATGIRYVGCAAARLASALPSIALGAEAAPPSHAAESLEVLASAKQGRFESARPAGDGLYRYNSRGRKRYLILRDGRWFHTSLAEGACLEAARHREVVIRWCRDGAPKLEQAGTLRVRNTLSVPALHARCLNFCSGLTPWFDGEDRVYDNVPHAIARKVATSLGLSLAVS